MRIVTVLFVLLVSAGSVVAQIRLPRPVGDALDKQPMAPGLHHGEYRVGQDDLLEIEVFEIPELGITARVAASGYVSLPLIGPVNVSGMTTLELATQIEESFREKYVRDPHVTVLIREYGVCLPTREYASQPVSMPPNP